MALKSKPRKPRVRKGSANRTWQSYKKDATRSLILDAVLECWAEIEYWEITVPMISERSGVSRGGIQYHFPSRKELMEAAIEHLNKKRLELYQADLSNTPEGEDLASYIVETHWKHLNEPYFSAHQQLVVASRFNPELNQIMSSHYRRFLQEWHETSRSVYGWQINIEEVWLFGKIAQFIMDGMAYGQLIEQIDQERVRNLLDYAKAIMRKGMETSRSNAVDTITGEAAITAPASKSLPKPRVGRSKSPKKPNHH